MNRKYEANILVKVVYLIAFISILTFGTCCFQSYMSYKYFERDFNVSLFVKKVNINKAGAKELQSLSGVGEKTAQKIIDGRPYKNTWEIYERGYVGTKTFNNIKNIIEI